MINILDEKNSILGKFISQMRDVNVQGDGMRFRVNLTRIGEIIAYELSKDLRFTKRIIETPLGEAEVMVPDEDIVIATILRSGIPFHQGFLNYFDDAQSAFVSAYRKYHKDGKFNINIEYISTTELTGKTLIITDPLLATGNSISLAHKALIDAGGVPAHTHIASVIASEEGLDYMRRHFSASSTTIWTAAVDSELTVKSYIVPGIGDVGDLAYGEKI